MKGNRKRRISPRAFLAETWYRYRYNNKHETVDHEKTPFNVINAPTSSHHAVCIILFFSPLKTAITGNPFRVLEIQFFSTCNHATQPQNVIFARLRSLARAALAFLLRSREFAFNEKIPRTPAREAVYPDNGDKQGILYGFTSGGGI